jgi:hypothetical protein
LACGFLRLSRTRCAGTHSCFARSETADELTGRIFAGPRTHFCKALEPNGTFGFTRNNSAFASTGFRSRRGPQPANALRRALARR